MFQPASDTLMSSNEPRGRGSHREASAENDEPYVPQIFLQCARTYASSTASAALVLRSVCERWPPRLAAVNKRPRARGELARPVKVYVGGQQPGMAVKAPSNVLSAEIKVAGKEVPLSAC